MKAGAFLHHFANIALILLAWSIPVLCGPIHDAARDGNVKKAKQLLRGHPELVADKDKYGMTPLHWAAQEGRTDVAKLLLANKAEVDARDAIAGWTSLHVGALEGHKDMDVNNIVYKLSYPPEEAWHHFAVETSDSGTTLFLDGSKVASNAIYVNNTVTAGKDLSMGVDVSVSGYAPYTDINVGYLYGYLDDIRIYNRALSESEILLLYHEGGWNGN
jgi:hypothetical protein